MLYFAYGSNLNHAAMARRCPDAVAVSRFTLLDARLVFRGVADCAYEPGAKCPGALWDVTHACVAALDRYEGIGSGMYRREYFHLKTGESVFYYVMNSTGIMPPDRHYLEVIKQGYRDFGMKFAPLLAAVKASWDEKNPSHVERQRRRRNGRPPLAVLAPPPKAKKANGRPYEDLFPE